MLLCIISTTFSLQSLFLSVISLSRGSLAVVVIYALFVNPKDKTCVCKLTFCFYCRRRRLVLVWSEVEVNWHFFFHFQIQAMVSIPFENIYFEKANQIASFAAQFVCWSWNCILNCHISLSLAAHYEVLHISKDISAVCKRAQRKMYDHFMHLGLRNIEDLSTWTIYFKKKKSFDLCYNLPSLLVQV